MLNKVILMGRLCADPDFRQTPSGVSVCRIRVAVDRRFANKQTGQREADFISVACWRQQAEFVNRYFRKGSMIVVEGSLQNNDYTDQSGAKHYGMVVQAENVSFGESKRDARQGSNAGATPPPPVGGPPPLSGEAQILSTHEESPLSDKADSDAMAQLGDLGDFEEILSDGDVPF